MPLHLQLSAREQVAQNLIPRNHPFEPSIFQCRQLIDVLAPDDFQCLADGCFGRYCPELIEGAHHIIESSVRPARLGNTNSGLSQ